MSSHVAPELQEFQLLSKCLGGLISTYDDEDPEVKKVRTKVAHDTVQRMQTLLTRHRAMGHAVQPEASGCCCKSGSLPVPKDLCVTASTDEPPAPLTIKGTKEVSAEDEQTGQQQLAAVKLLNFVEECLLTATSQHIPGWVVLSSSRQAGQDGLLVQLQSISAQTMPPQDDAPTHEGPPIKIKLSIQPA